MKKFFGVLLAVMMIVALFAGCKAAGGEKFVVGFDAEFPPYGYMDENGEYVGFDLDLAQEVCKRNNWEYVAQPIDWNAKDAELNAGTISCIWNGFTMDGRLEDYTWSAPYVDNSQVFVVKADSGIASQADLAGKIVVTQAASSALDALESDDCAALKASFAQLLEVPDYNTAFLNLEAGSVDAIAMDVGVANYQIKTRGSDAYVILDDVLVSEQYGVGFKLGNTELCEKVEKTLHEMLDDGTFMEIADKWGLSDSIIYK